MKQPRKLLNLPELARRLGVFYSQVYTAHKSGILTGDFVDNFGRPLFEESSLTRAILSLRSKLTADEFLQVASRIKPSSDTEAFQMVDITNTFRGDA